MYFSFRFTDWDQRVSSSPFICPHSTNHRSGRKKIRRRQTFKQRTIVKLPAVTILDPQFSTTESKGCVFMSLQIKWLQQYKSQIYILIRSFDFLAVEKRCGIHVKNELVIIPPRIKRMARCWYNTLRKLNVDL